MGIPIQLHSMTLHFPDGGPDLDIVCNKEGQDGFYRVSDLVIGNKQLIQHEVFITHVIRPNESKTH